MDGKIMVSVICSAYNQEKYIAEALDSFLMQRTDFAFEVLVHDDASTDSTADIIRRYQKKYPDLIKPYFQTENQYSKGISISLVYQFPRAQGKYLAICEGDDYWTDPLKLQKQFDVMERHPECDMCACGSVIIDAETGRALGHSMRLEKTGVIPARSVIDGEGGRFVMTNSLFFRRELNDRLPEFRRIINYDYTLQIHGALRGGLMYIAEEMTAYRSGAPGSWTVKMKGDPRKKLNHYTRVGRALKQLDKDTNGEYRSTINRLRFRNFMKKTAVRLRSLRPGRNGK